MHAWTSCGLAYFFLAVAWRTSFVLRNVSQILLLGGISVESRTSTEEHDRNLTILSVQPVLCLADGRVCVVNIHSQIFL